MQTPSTEPQTPHTAGATPVPSQDPSNSSASPTPPGRFVERRKSNRGAKGAADRRQFGSSYHDLSPDARELALAIDGYKVKHRRRYVTFEEMLSVIHELGYQRPSAE